MERKRKARLERALLPLSLALCALLGAATSAWSQTAGSVGYAYDSLGRLTSVTYDTGAQIVYSYDAMGNRSAVTINVGQTLPPVPPTPPTSSPPPAK